MPGLIRIVVDGLLAQENETGIFFLRQCKKDLGRGQRFHRRIGLYQDRAVGAHRQRGAQLLLCIGHADADRNDFDVAAAFLDTQSFLEGDLVERIDAHFDAVQHHAAAVRLDADAHVVIHDALDTNHDFLH